MAKAKTKEQAFPQGWVEHEGPDGWTAVKHFTESELVAYGDTRDDLLGAVDEYERKIAAGQIKPR